MPRLLSGSTLRRGGSGEFLDLKGAMPQLPPNENTSTGYTVVTDALYRTRYRSSLGNLEMNSGTIYSNLPDGMIRLAGTNSGFVYVTSSTISVSTQTGALVIKGGVGIGNTIYVEEDIHVNGLTIGRGYEGQNNIVILGTATNQTDTFNNGQQSIAIGYDTLGGLSTAYKNIAIGRYALNSGTKVSKTIAIGDSALRASGSVNEYHIGNITNITNDAPITITGASNTNPVVITSNNHQLSTGTKIYVSGVVGMTTTIIVSGNTTTVSLLNNTAFWVNPLTTSTFELYSGKIFSTATSVNGTTYQPYVSGGTIYKPFVVNVTYQGLTTGTYVLIKGVNGLTNGLLSLVNDKYFYIDSLSTTSVALYTNSIVTIPVNSQGYIPYVNSGSLFRPLLANNNIAIGVDAGKGLVDGEQNFFFGDGIAKNLTTGSYNFFIGHDVANNLTKGNANIAIGGDNLVDGKDNQINIGSVFYYDGDGYLQLNADTGVGIGTIATATDYAAFTVFGGIGITANALVGGKVEILDISQSTTTNNGALVVRGGLGVYKNLNVGQELKVRGTGDVDLSPFAANVYLKPSLAGTVQIYPPDTTGYMDNMIVGSLNPANAKFLNIEGQVFTATSTATSISTTTGAIQVYGGIGVGKDVYINGSLTVLNGIVGIITTATNLQGGNTGSIPYQITPGITTLLPIGGNNQILTSNGTTPFWSDLGVVQFTTATYSKNIYVGTATSGTYYIGLVDTIGDFSPLDATNLLSYNIDVGTLSLGTTTTSTSTTTGALVVNGGVGIQGSVYSKEGNPQEGYLLYTPRVTPSPTPPANPRVGDFWIDTTTAIEFQFIKDGTSTFWIQFAEL